MVAMTVRSLTLRLPEEQAKELEGVARIDEMTFTDAVRTAIAEYIEARRNDSAFQARIRRILDEDRAMLERLLK